MNPDRRTALYAGLWFIGTFVFSIPGYLLYGSALDDVNYVIGEGNPNVRLAAFLEILLAISGIATAVVFYRIVRRVSESISLGYVALRIVESTMILVGLISMLSLVTMREDFANATGADSGLYVGLGRSLVALHDWTFIIGPAFCAALGNGIMLGYLLYRGELVPRGWGVFGMVAGTIALVSATCQLFDVFANQSTPAAILIVPEFIWEAFVGIYMTFWGFRRSSPVLDREDVLVS
jgi:Domain of unknown function (DUF4386)